MVHRRAGMYCVSYSFNLELHRDHGNWHIPEQQNILSQNRWCDCPWTLWHSLNDHQGRILIENSTAQQTIFGCLDFEPQACCLTPGKQCACLLGQLWQRLRRILLHGGEMKTCFEDMTLKDGTSAPRSIKAMTFNKEPLPHQELSKSRGVIWKLEK